MGQITDHLSSFVAHAISEPPRGSICAPLGLMTPSHPLWNQFAQKLEGPEGCNFRKEENGEFRWDCKSGRDKTHAIRILREMGASDPDIFYSLQYFEASGGYCDCEILFNIDAPQRRIAANAAGNSRTRKNPRLKVSVARRIKRTSEHIQ